MGSAGFLISLALLVGGIWLVAEAGGMKEGILVWWAWLSVTVVGLLFVGGQVLSAAALISLVFRGETEPPADASNPSEHQDS